MCKGIYFYLEQARSQNFYSSYYLIQQYLVLDSNTAFFGLFSLGQTSNVGTLVWCQFCPLVAGEPIVVCRN